MPDFEISDACVVKLGTAAAPTTLVDYSNYFKTFKTSDTTGDEDITTFGTVSNSAKILAYLLNEATFDADVEYNGATWKAFGDIIRGKVKVSLWVYPKGDVVGNELWQVTVLLTARARELSVSATDKGTVAFKRTGPAVETVVPNGG